MSVWVDVVLVNLIEEDLCGVGIVDALNLFGKDLFAPGREISMEKGVFVNDAGSGGGRYGRESGGEEKVGTGRNNSRLMIPGVMRRDGVKVLVV